MAVTQRQTPRVQGLGIVLGVRIGALVALAAGGLGLGGCSYSCVDEYRTIRNIEVAPASGDGSPLISMIPTSVDRHQTAMADATGPTRTDNVDPMDDRR